MTRDNWTTATAGRREGYSIAGRAFLAILTLCNVLTLIWAVSNQTIFPITNHHPSEVGDERTFNRQRKERHHEVSHGGNRRTVIRVTRQSGRSDEQ